MVRAILFDLGDTLLDFQPLDTKSIVKNGARDSYQRLEQVGCKLPSLKRYHNANVRAVKLGLILAKLRGQEFNLLNMMRRRTARLGAPDTDQFMHEVGWLWYKHVVPYSSIEPDLVSTLQVLRNAGLKLGIVSNTFVGGVLLDRHLQVMGLLDYFPVRIYSCEFGVCKPNPRIFKEALSAIGMRPQETMFVGDVVKNDVIGAGRLGMTTVLKQPRSMAPKHPIANHLIRRISDLLPIVLPASEVAATRA
ncbi:MAG: HAD family hydrolase [Planctomycetota bacterium]|nr:HAD family hydrolase [Planctomycetota bacterium]